MNEVQKNYHEPSRFTALTPYSSFTAKSSDRMDYVAAPAVQEGSKLAEYASLVFYRKWTLLLGAVLGAVIGIGVASIQEPRFNARAVLEARSLNERFLNRENFDPAAGNTVSGPEAYLKTQLHVLGSDWLLKRTLAQLVRQPEKSNCTAALEIRQEDLRGSQERALNALRKNLSTSVVDQTRLIEVESQARTAECAATFVNALANELIAADAEANRDSMHKTRELLAQELTGLKSKLIESENELHLYAQNEGLLLSNKAENLEENQLTRAQTDLMTAQAHRIAKQAEFEQSSTANTSVIPEVLNDTVLKDFRTRRATLRQQLMELSSILTPSHYKVKQVEAQIKELEAEQRAYKDDILQRIRNEYESSLRREDLLRRAYRTEAKTLAAQSAKAVRYTLLKHSVDINRQLYESTLQKVKEAEVISAMQSTNIRLVDPASPSQQPSSPHVIASMGVGVCGGLLFSLLLVAWQERSGRNFSTATETATYLNLPELGAIPSRRTTPAVWLPGRVRSRPPLTTLASQDSSLGTLTPAADYPSSEVESYRAVVTSILCGGWNMDTGSCLVVTSPGSGEGKTTTTANLAVALGRTGRKTLVVDADLRRPNLHNMFGLQNERGLKDLLEQGNFDDLQSMIQPAQAANVSVLTSGSGPCDVLSLLDSPHLPKLIRLLKVSFDTVLIDTPPMLNMADARVLGRLSQGVVLVVRAGQTRRSAAQSARMRLANDGTALVGVVLSDWNPRYPEAHGYHSYQRRSPEVLTQ